MKYIVHFRESSAVTVEVDADAPEEALNAAWQRLPGSLCNHCTGSNGWSRDTGGEVAALTVTDAAGKEVLSVGGE